MANELLYSGLSDLQLAAILHQETLLLLADRAALEPHPAILDLGDISGRSSTALKVSLGGLDGYNEMGAVAEGSAASNSALTDGSVTITIARQAIQRTISDLAGIVNGPRMDPARLVADCVGAGRMRLMSMIASLSSSFTNPVGSTGVAMSVDDFFDGDILLNMASVPADGRLAVLHGRQVGDLRQSLRAESGALQWDQPTLDMIKASGPGMIGRFLGYDIFQSSKCPAVNSGADRAGMMVGRGAIGKAMGTRRPMIGDAGQAVPAGTAVWIGFERDESYAFTKVVGNMYAGVAILQDSLGVSVVTDHE